MSSLNNLFQHPSYERAVASEVYLTQQPYEETELFLMRRGEERDDQRTPECLTLRDIYRGIPWEKKEHVRDCEFCKQYRLSFIELVLSSQKASKPILSWWGRIRKFFSKK
ncbi:MAG: hypothetical protein HZA36_01150 [Parcubacteria group bacterium]|nr:hypothetical protein [Parcubacteria group bacterium]